MLDLIVFIPTAVLHHLCVVKESVVLNNLYFLFLLISGFSREESHSTCRSVKKRCVIFSYSEYVPTVFYFQHLVGIYRNGEFRFLLLNRTLSRYGEYCMHALHHCDTLINVNSLTSTYVQKLRFTI